MRAEAAAGGAPSREGHARAARATILRAENMLGRMVGFWEISGRGLDAWFETVEAIGAASLIASQHWPLASMAEVVFVCYP